MGLERSAKRKMAAKTIPTNIFLRFMEGVALYPPFPEKFPAILPIDWFDLDLLRPSFFVGKI
jgi:hypothetical protein